MARPALGPPRAAYLHVPFCARRCGYCNFTVAAGRDDLIEAFLQALERELGWLETPREVDTLFIGGGTPTHMPPAALARLLALARRWFPLGVGYEFSVEANPIDVDADRTSVLAEYGVTRVSLGAQSFQPEKLRSLERDHVAADIARAVERLRPAVKSISLDLIFATPGETAASWLDDLHKAIRLAPDHVSTYGLTFERGTTFWARRLRNELRSLDEETERTLFGTAIAVLAAAGFEHYEVSNFARPGHRCRHNETYWAGREYFAAGPGAARYIDGRREINHRSTTTWLARVMAGKSPVAESEQLAPEERAREALVIGLRRLAGVDRAEFLAQTGFEVDRLAGAAVAGFVERGLIDDDGRRVRLTREGLFVSDALWSKLLAK